MIEHPPSAVLLFDGTCGFCARSVQFVLQHEGRRRTLRFASLESRPGTEIRRRHPELDAVDSVVWVESAATDFERVHVRSAAALRVLRYLGGVWGVLGVLGAVVPAVARDWMYDVVARHRHELMPADRAGGPACLLPSPDQRARFIEWEPAGTSSSA